MTLPTRRSVLVYLAGTFLLGAIAGGAMGYSYGRRPVFKPFDRDAMRTKFCDRLVRDLSLSDDQKQQLDPIIRKNMEEFEAVHRDHFRQLDEIMKTGRQRVASILTPEQKAKFEAMEKEREQRMPKHGSQSDQNPLRDKPSTNR